MKERIDTLLSLQYPTRQDMRECMQLQKDYIAELEQKLTSDNSDYAKCEKSQPCKHEAFINSLGEPQSNREYWLLTEFYVYLHGGKDFCISKSAYPA